jgi:flagellar biosynthetic protein FlhB
MAESSQDKTEQPTPERLRKARGEGRIPVSQELPSALLIASLLAASYLAASSLWQWFTLEARQGLSLEPVGGIEIDTLVHLMKAKGSGALVAIAPWLGACTLGGMLGSVLVGGWTIAPGAMKLKFEALTPSASLGSLFSPRSAVSLLAAVVKLLIIGTVAWMYLNDKLGVCLAMFNATPLQSLTTSLGLVFGLVARITIALLAIGLADAIYQRWQYKRELRMTREEVREERKQYEGSPLVKARARSLHMAIVRKRMLRSVPTADVVVANPTHVAVALKYDSATMEAPQVVAKGADILCAKIKEIAREHNVPVVEKPELARALYDSAEVGQTIPEPLYVAVAEILAMIYRLRKQKA